MVYRDSVFALFDPDRSIYRTAEGVTYILTHECDVEVANDRLFNTDLLVCPLMPLELLVEELQAVQTREQVAGFLGNLGARNIPRLVYLPPITGAFDHGAVMFLNQITNAPAEVLRSRAHLVCALTAFGLAEVEYALEHHLLRPKAERIALSGEPVPLT